MVAVPFSLYVKEVLLVVVIVGGSFTPVTVIVTARYPYTPPSEARTERL